MRQLTRNVISLGWAALLLVGLPVGLIRLAGWPLPAHLPSRDELAGWVAQPLTRETVIAAAACVAWLMWAALLAAALAEVYTHAARLCRHLPRLHPPGPLQGLSAAMLGTVAVSTAGAGATPAAAHAGVAVAGTAHPVLPVLTSQDTAAAPATVAPVPAGPSGDGHVAVPAGRHHDSSVTVQLGDTLSTIAADQLGDATRWPEIFALNHGTHFSDVGGTLTDPDLIYPGWALRLPDDATPPPATTPSAPPREQSGPGQPVPHSTAPAPSASQSIAAPSTGPSCPAAVLPSSPTGDDGITVPDPPAASTPPPRATPAPSRSASNLPAASRSAGTPAGVSLPGGSWLDMGLVAAVLAAVALVWAHRRRRYTRRPPSPQLRLDDPATQPMPAVVTQIRRALRRPVPEPPDDGVDVEFFDIDATDEHDAEFDDEPDFDDDRDNEVAFDDPSPPVTPALNNLVMDVWPPAGLGLIGPGAEGAARGFLAAALAAGGLDDPDGRSRVVIPAATAATLLGADTVTVPDTPRLTVTAGLDDALEILETQILHRTRLVYRHEVDNVAALRHADPFEEPLPPIVFVADATAAHERARIAALLTQGQRLDIHGVLLGAWPDGNTVVVAADGTTRPADGKAIRHGSHPAGIGRLAILTPAETSDLLVTLAESHTGQPQAPAPIEPAATVSAQAVATTRPTDQEASPQAQPIEAVADPSAHAASPPDAQASPAAAPVQPGDAVACAAAGAADRDRSSGDGEQTPPTAPVRVPAEPGSADGGHDSAVEVPATAANADANAHARGDEGADGAMAGTVKEPDADSASEDREEAGPGRVQVTVLGAAGIVDVPPGPPPRKKSLEVLVYLAVHDGDAPAEAILDDLLPDAPASKAPGRLYTYVSDLRTIMRRTGGRATYLTHPNQRYVLNHDTVDVDLWRMRAAIREADQATDPQQRIAALRRAVGTYGGRLAEGADYEWIEPYRETVRLQALDAFLALADAVAGNPAEQVTVLDAAIRHNPYAEELYQQAMRARAALGHLDAIRTLRRSLTRALAGIDAEPSDNTIALADQLVAQAQRPGRRPDLRPAPHPGDAA